MGKILLVDDEPKVLRALTAALEDDYEVCVSESGSDAKSMISSGEVFDVIITDELMPDVKGHDLLNWCGQHAPDSKLMMLTGLPVTEELKQQLHDVQAVTIVTKPWDLEQLISAFPKKEEAVKSAPIEKQQRHGKMLVLESSNLYRQLYLKFQRAYFDDVVLFNEAHELLNYKDGSDVSYIALNLQEVDESSLKMLLSVLKLYPNADILVTAPPFAVKQLRAIKALPSQISLLVQPFSFKRLVAVIGQ